MVSLRRYIDTINDKGKNRKVATDKGISIGIITEIRKVGVERVRVNMFDRKAQELVVAKFCGTEGFGEDYTGLADLTETAKELCERFLTESTVVPDLTPQYPHEEQEVEYEIPPIDEYIHDDEYIVDEEYIVDNEDVADVETLPPSVETVKSPRTMFSIIIDTLKSFGRIFSRR